MARFDKVRYMYLRYPVRHDDRHCKYVGKFDHHPHVDTTSRGYPHTCIVTRVDPEANEIHYATAKCESPGALIRLKARMAMIQSLGGVVPASLNEQRHSFSHDYSKKRARWIACRRLDNSPTIITGLKIDELNAHSITAAVMDSIAAQSNYSPTLGRIESDAARDGANEWLREHVHGRDTQPEFKARKMNSGDDDLMTVAAVVLSDSHFSRVALP